MVQEAEALVDAAEQFSLREVIDFPVHSSGLKAPHALAVVEHPLVVVHVSSSSKKAIFLRAKGPTIPVFIPTAVFASYLIIPSVSFTP